MKYSFLAAMMLAPACCAAPALAQVASISQSIAGTRLDLDSHAEVLKVPDIATISAGVVARAPSASGALKDSADRLARVLASLRHAGIEERDIETSNISLAPEYRYPQNEAPQLVAYTATNTLRVRFRDIRTSGKILDALVAEGANQINGPSFSLDHPEEALDEARAKAVAAGKARAELYARSLGLKVARLVALSESPGSLPRPIPVMALARSETTIEPGEQKLGVDLHLTFELQ